MSKHVFRPFNTYGIIAIGVIVSSVLLYAIVQI